MGDHLVIGVEGRVVVGDQHRGAAREDGDRNELAIVLFAKAHDFVEHRIFGAHQQGVAVRRRTGDVVQGDGPDRAGHVLHDDGAAERLFGVRGHGAHHRVGGAAGPPLDNALDFFFRVFGNRHGRRECKRANSADQHSLHVFLP